MFAESTSTASANQRSSGPPCVPRNEKSNSCSAQRNSAPGTSASSAAHYPRKTAVSLTGSRDRPPTEHLPWPAISTWEEWEALLASQDLDALPPPRWSSG
ncbi:uncharacterized protein LOC142804024 isoform X2 [Rhipicephalus microplus]|uniref:uncharacterized protein LOC142804024 isoform X2 n=1 Tax=Rhipicephalus microplus TaxID=6941 RepID=UPI003F6B0BFB